MKDKKKNNTLHFKSLDMSWDVKIEEEKNSHNTRHFLAVWKKNKKRRKISVVILYMRRHLKYKSLIQRVEHSAAYADYADYWGGKPVSVAPDCLHPFALFASRHWELFDFIYKKRQSRNLSVHIIDSSKIEPTNLQHEAAKIEQKINLVDMRIFLQFWIWPEFCIGARICVDGCEDGEGGRNRNICSFSSWSTRWHLS